MTWVSLDDKFPEHPKIDALSDAAFRLHVSAICYSNRLLTDGVVPPLQVPRLVPHYNRKALDELTNGSGLWLPNTGPIGGYEIGDFLDWNRSRQQIEEARERKSKGGRKGAQRRWHDGNNE